MEELERALNCADGVIRARTDPVILVHGSPATPDSSWRSGYVYALAGEGIPACTVELPDWGMDDLQIATEYVVHAIRRVAALSDRHVSVVGHSNGGLGPLWALRFWPDMREHVTDLVGLSAPYSGGPESLCNPDCAPSVWQGVRGSRFLVAATAPPLPEGPSYTSIATESDGFVTPEDAHLDGAENIVLQDICPGRPVVHGAMLYDSVAYQLFLDARSHDGSAKRERLPAGVCGGLAIPMNPRTFPEDLAELSKTFLVISATYPHVPAEPELFCYADRESSRGVGTYCPPFGRSATVEP